MQIHRRRKGRPVLLLVVAVLAVGCAAYGQGSDASLHLSVEPADSLMDAPLSIVVSGAPPSSAVTLVVSSTDVRHVSWTSSSTFRVGSSGSVDVASDPSIAGSYTGVDAMGPLDFMSAGGVEAAYHWNGQSQTFTFIAMDGEDRVSASITRSTGRALDSVETIAATGFVGQFWAIPSAARGPSVLLFGGSEGGLSGQLVSDMLAAHGFPTLDLAYFKEPGLPATLSDIPLEYFAVALRWLAAQPEVDATHIWVIGDSRGSEAAQLLAVHYPGLVHGIIASSPSDVALCAYPSCSTAAWTFQGKTVPTTYQLNTTDPTDDSAAVIPIGSFHGPILLDCGGEDGVWISCQYAGHIIDALTASHDTAPHVLLTFPNAGHGIGGLLPHEPGFATSGGGGRAGGTPFSVALAWAQLWPKVLAFLNN